MRVFKPASFVVLSLVSISSLPAQGGQPGSIRFNF
jgi:hypothetical protein